MEQRCETCEFWQVSELEPPDRLRMKQRACIRYPPKHDGTVVTRWPRTAYFERCGEWRLRPDPDAPVSDRTTGMA